MHRPLGAILLGMLSAAALADPCTDLPPPSIELKREEARLSYNFTYRQASLQGMAYGVVRPGMRVLGLTRGVAMARYDLQLSLRRSLDGRWECGSPKISFSYGYTPLTVYVASEFPRGTCAYDQIYAHEMAHVAIYQRHAEALESVLRDELRRRFADLGIWRGSAGQVQQQLQQELDARWLPYIKRRLQAVEAEQATIDTPEEYARVAAACNGEIGRRLTVDR